MKPRSIHALMWFSIILLVAGWLVMSPAASLLLAVIVIVCALLLIFFGRLTPCLIGAVILAGSIGLAATQYTEAVKQLKTFKNHAKKSSATASSAPLAK